MYVLLGLILAGKAQAQSLPDIEHEINCTYYPSLQPPTLVADPQSLDIGQMLTPWVYEDPILGCQAEIIDGPEKIAMLRSNTLALRLPLGMGLANIPAVMDEGQAHTVYTIPGVEGIGYILKAQHYENNIGGAWSALNLTPGSEYTQIPFNWLSTYEPPEEKPYEDFYTAFKIALVKIDEVSQWPPSQPSINFTAVESTVKLDVVVAGASSPLPAIDLPWEPLGFQATADDSQAGGGTCTPVEGSNVHIILPPALLSEFDGYGSVARERYVFLDWVCDPSVQALEYEFYIASGKPSPDASQGLLPQEHPSGASGVAIQVFDIDPLMPPGGSDPPIEFGVPKPMTKFSGVGEAATPFYGVLLKAQYYKIATDVGADVMTAGSVEAGLTMLIQFP